MAETAPADTSTNHLPSTGKLFSGQNFFLVQRLPGRKTYLEKIKSNGGHIVKIESQAHYVLADHLRKDAPAGSLSYTFVDAAVTSGYIPEPQDHIIKSAENAPRIVGSASIPGKRTRTPFTSEDDLALWKCVERARSQGMSIKGNEIYKDLAVSNSRHTWQSWRDRYVKILSLNPPIITVAKGVGALAPTSLQRSPPPELSSRVSTLQNKIAERAIHTKEPSESTTRQGRSEATELPDCNTKAEIESRARHRLTEANLARQQEQHDDSPFRAVDLPEEQEKDQDQSAIVESLQRVTGASTAQQDDIQKFQKPEVHVMNSIAHHDQDENGIDYELPGYEENEDSVNLDLPLTGVSWHSQRPSHHVEAEDISQRSKKRELTVEDERSEPSITPSPRNRVLSLEKSSHEPVQISPAASLSSPSASFDFHKQALANRTLDTQAILDMESPVLELTLPLPPDSSEDATALYSQQSSRLRRKRSQSATSPMRDGPRKRLKLQSQARDLGQTDALDLDDLDNYIRTLQVSNGYAEKDIVDALRKTSLRPELAELALAEYATGRGWPTDVPGIWSDEEDEIVSGSDSREISTIAAKMTWPEVFGRLHFLEQWHESS